MSRSAPRQLLRRSVTTSRGLRVCFRPRACLKKRLAAFLSRLAMSSEVDRLAGAVDRPVQVAPLPADPNVRLVVVPWPAARTQGAAHPLLELRDEALNPAVHGRVIHRDAAIGEHPFEVAVADRKLQIPAHGPKDYLGREAEAPKRSGGVGHERYSQSDAGGSTAPTRERCPPQCNRSAGGAGSRGRQVK